jgi:hypothetical protein
VVIFDNFERGRRCIVEGAMRDWGCAERRVVAVEADWWQAARPLDVGTARN